MSRIVIAIDGPAASGKSSVAKGLAEQLGISYLNSGAMYRAATWHILQSGIDPSDTAQVVATILTADIQTGFENGRSVISIDGFRPTEELRDPRVNRSVSAVSAVPEVREQLVREFHRLAREHDCVVEGRDIGSVVFPSTPYKFYLDASPEERQRRRAAEGQSDEVSARDRSDSSRRTAPLTIAADASVIDTTHMDLGEVIAAIHAELAARGCPVALDPRRA
jgi:cytidylate kinase